MATLETIKAKAMSKVSSTFVKDGTDTTITFVAPEAMIHDISVALLLNFGYKAQIEDPEDSKALITNPESPESFALRMILEFGIENYVIYKNNLAAVAAKEASDTATASVFGNIETELDAL